MVRFWWRGTRSAAQETRQIKTIGVYGTDGVGAFSVNLAESRHCKRYRGHPPTQPHTDAVAHGKGQTSLAGVSLQAVSWLACAMFVACSSCFCPVGQAPGEKSKSNGPCDPAPATARRAQVGKRQKGGIPKQTPSTSIDARSEREQGEGDQSKAPKRPKKLRE